MAEEEKKELDQQTEENAQPQDNVDKSSSDEKTKDKSKKDKKGKNNAKAERESLSAKEKAQKEWEDSLVANKRVKREIARRKATRALALILILSILLTSVVYVMLLFIEENSIRITAKSKDERTISLSADGEIWAPKLNVDGPDNIWNISYHPAYEDHGMSEQTVPTIDEFREMISSTEMDKSVNGQISQKSDLYIAFSFMLKNTSELYSEDIGFRIRMNVDATGNNRKDGLVDAIRVMWIEEYGDIAAHIGREDYVNHTGVYATGTTNEQVINMQYTMFGMTDEEGNKPTFVPEKCSYPISMVDDAKKTIDINYKYTEEDEKLGLFDTICFKDEQTAFEYESFLAPDEIVRFVVCVWVEGSDFDCNDSALNTSVSLNIDFEVI